MEEEGRWSKLGDQDVQDGRDQDVQDGSPAVKSSKMHFVVVSDQRAVHLCI